MKRFSILFAAVILAASNIHLMAGDAKIEVAIAKDKDSKPETSFEKDVPKLYAFFKTAGTKKGDKIRGVWIAEDVGSAAPANTKIDESTVTGDKDDFFGAFSLSKPTNGWPEGKYRVEIYSGDELVTKANFTIGLGRG